MKLKAAGGELHYDVRGEGPAVLFLHAFPLDLSMWDAQAEALRDAYRVLRLDARGFGASSPGEGLLTMERIADDAAALLDHVGLARATLCGCSMGGYAAFAFVRRHADRLRGLVLADTRSLPDTPEGRQSRSVVADKVRQQGPSAAVDAFLPRLLGETSQRERPELVALVRALALQASVRGVTDALAGLSARADSTPTLREIRVPTLVVCGAEDTLSPPSEAEAMHKAIAGSRLEILPRAGHLANLEQPEAFNAALRGFLDRLR
jgi:3-oxoadipate enol-lactonase